MYTPQGVLGLKASDRSAVLDGVGKDAESAVFGNVGQVEKLHSETGVGLVAAETVHGLGIGQAFERQLNIDVESLFKQAFHKALAHGDDVLHVHKGHFKVDLGKFGLTVGTQILVAEAAGNLHIAVKAGNHGQLLVNLRRLGKSIEFALVYAARNKKIAGALGGGFYEHGGLDFYKSVFVEVVPCDLGDAVAHENVFLKVGTAQVEIAVFKAKFFLDVGVFDNFKGWGLRKTEHLKLADGNFNLSGGNVFVHRRTAADNAGGGQEHIRL